eukprot:jgi/Botrbrau1/17166/Bobra.0157s0060.2
MLASYGADSTNIFVDRMNGKISISGRNCLRIAYVPHRLNTDRRHQTFPLIASSAGGGTLNPDGSYPRPPPKVTSGREQSPKRFFPGPSQKPPPPPTGGGGGLGGSGGGGSSEGAGGDGDSPSGGDGNFLVRGWRERVAADSEFPFKVLIEQVIGVGASVLGDMSSRPYWGLYELDFVFSTLVVGSILNFSLMYLLAPTVGSSAASNNLIGKFFSEQTLKNWGAPGGHMFESGYSFSARATNFLYKGVVFAVVGFAAALVGTAMSNGLIALRSRLDKNFKSQNKPPNVVLNAGTWAAHMGISSNLRYQMINGLDTVVQPLLSRGVFKLYSSGLRAFNNIIGGMSFVTLAKLFGVQSSAGDEIKTSAKAKK